MLKRSRYKITYFVKSLLFLPSWNSYRLLSQWNWRLICCVERYNRCQIQLFPHILNKIVCIRIYIVKRAKKQVKKLYVDNVRRLKFTILPYRKTNPPGAFLFLIYMFSLRKTADLITFLLICPLPWIFFVQSGFL